MSPDPTRALVVDDDPGLLGVYAEVLQDEGYDVVTAADGAEASRRLAAGGYDVLLCDMVLPDSSGLEVMQAVRREGLDLPIVLVTGHPTLETAVVAVEKGASRYLQKPVSREELLETLDTVIREHREGAREREIRARAAGARRALEGAFETALDSIQTACEPVVALSDGRLFAYCAVTADRSRGLSWSRAMLEAARRFHREEDYSRALRRSAAAVRRVAGRAHPLLVATPLADVVSGRLLEDDEPLRPLSSDVFLDIWPALPRQGGTTLVDKLATLREAGYRLALPVPGLERSELVRELGTVDLLRLDADLLTDLERDPVRQALVRDAAAVASEAKARLVVSGFATAELRGVLAELGCHLLQACHRHGADAPRHRAREGGASGLRGWWARWREGVNCH